jgi:predicted dehydrogenase
MSGEDIATGVGLIGCGNISGIYLQNIQRLPGLRLVGCADLEMARTEAKATEYGVKACSVEQLLADPAVEIVLNLTIPKAHAQVATQALQAGKHVYGEKPLSVTGDTAASLMKLAEDKNLRIGCAPDTFLGGGLQTCRKLIDDGWIGAPVAATAFMLCHGHESWHPDPAFYYERGGGPMLDMGPYYLTALTSLLGPVRRVTGSTRTTFPTRTITSQPRFGTAIEVEVPTHWAAVLDFANGVIGTLVTSFDVWAANVPLIEIYGTTGSLAVPDPNGFEGPVRVRRAGSQQWVEMPLSHGNTENSRGLGLADMAQAIRSGRSHRASGELAFHVLDIMEAVDSASREGRHIELASTCDRPDPLPMSRMPGMVDV